ncbi:dTDP-4-dehydrorhamnose 3,5-epimerase [Candidatus Parcubacteria bacterium]|nr:MAG: dTDP-4-dehydrorhamnose 3,5-epimerase [Candidatus Parcubacteria bacterium]
MKKIKTDIQDLFVIEYEVFSDERGVFFEFFNQDKFNALKLDFFVKQANHSFSKQGVLRGLHFQKEPQAMAKLVRCSKGKIWDVAVDLRPDSPSFKKWFGIELSPENKKMLYIPAGFAHGFYALKDCEVQYLTDNTYNKELDAGVFYNDPELNIDWPVLEGYELILSDRDKSLPLLRDVDL